MPCCKGEREGRGEIASACASSKWTARTETYPERTRRECGDAAAEAGLLAFGSDALVDAFAEPDVGLHVPRVEEDLEVLCKFDIQDVHVRRAFPLCTTRLCVAREA